MIIRFQDEPVYQSSYCLRRDYIVAGIGSLEPTPTILDDFMDKADFVEENMMAIQNMNAQDDQTRLFRLSYQTEICEKDIAFYTISSAAKYLRREEEFRRKPRPEKNHTQTAFIGRYNLSLAQ